MSYRRAANLDKNLIFAEYFNSEQEVRRNPNLKVLSSLTINEGEWNGDGSSEKIELHRTLSADTDYTFRFQVKISDITPPSGRYFLDFRYGDTSQAVYMGWNQTGGGELFASGAVPYNLFVNTVDTIDVSSLENEWIEVVIQANINYNVAVSCITRFYGGSTNSECDIRLFEIYNKILTQEEITNLYNDARYRLPSLNKNPQYGEERVEDPNINDASKWNLASAPNFTWRNGGFDVDETAGAGSIYQDTVGIVHVVGNRYRVEIEFEESDGGNCYWHDGGGLQVFTPAIGASVKAFNYTANGVSQFLIRGSSAFTGRIIRLSWKQISVEPTQEILNVNAFSGIARNELSGDAVGIELSPDPYFSDVSNFIPDRWSVSGNKATVAAGSNTTCQFLNEPNVLVVGKTFRIYITVEDVSALHISNGYLRVYLDSSTGYADLRMDEGFKAGDHYLDITCSHLTEYFAIRAVSVDNAGALVVSKFSVKELIPEVTNTDIEVVKQGEIYAPRFNGTTSKVDCGDYHDLTGDITVLAWVVPFGYGETNGGAILRNGRFNLIIDDFARFRVQNAGATVFNFGSWELQDRIFVAVVRKADGLVTGYIDGEQSGVETDADTPVAGDTNITIGNKSTNDRTWDGELPEVRVIEGLLTAAEISQYYTATKHKYQK